jgi:hypothetical protein
MTGPVARRPHVSPTHEGAPAPPPADAEDTIVGRDEEDGFRLRAIIGFIGSPTRRVPILPVVVAAVALTVAVVGVSLLVMLLVDVL